MGIAGVIMTNWSCMYYNVIIAWVLYYMVLTFQKRLPWAHCDNHFNTEDCLDPEWIYGNTSQTEPYNCEGIEESENTTTKVLKQVCLNGTLTNLSDFTPAVVELWE